MSQKEQHVLHLTFQFIVDQTLKTETINELWEKMQLLTSLTPVFTEKSERETLIGNNQMNSLWDNYEKLLKSEYLEVFYPPKPPKEDLSMYVLPGQTGFVHKWKPKKEIVDMYENREWDPWLLGQFFNPMFWIRDNRHFFSQSDERDFNQKMKNAFKKVADKIEEI